MFKYKVSEINDDQLEKIINNVSIIFITVTETERKAFCDVFRPLPSIGKFIKLFHDSCTYYIGRIGHYPIAYTECNMGFIAPSGSLLTIKDSIHFLKPRVIIMPGIAFGINKAKQHLADILISESIIPYDFERISEEENKPRYVPGMKQPSVILLDRFKKTYEWQYRVGKKRLATKHIGGIFSGSKLIDNMQYRDNLVKIYASLRPIGGEMEGTGISSACAGEHVEFIVVKGICDWADGKKNKRNQPKASKASISLCNHVFSQRKAFIGLGLKPIDEREIIAQEIAEIVDTRRGSKLWLLYSLRANILTSLIEDIAKHNLTGLDDNCCKAIIDDLQFLNDLSKTIPNEVFDGKTLSYYFNKFISIIENWASVKGTSPMDSERRVNLVDQMKRIRKKISTNISKSYFGLSIYTNNVISEEMISAQKILANEFPHQFPGLSMALERMERKRSK